MKVTVATDNSDLSILKRLYEPLVIYTANEDVHKKILKIRDNINYMTIIIVDKYKKNINQVILEYGKSLIDKGAIDLEPFELKDSNNYIVPIFIILVIIAVLLILGLSFYRNNGKNR